MRIIVAAAALLALTACSPAKEPAGVQAQAPTPEAAAPPPVPAQSVPPPVAEPAPSPPSVAGPQAAADVVRAYYALLDAHIYAKAWDLWAGGGSASGATREAFAAQAAKYNRYQATVGAPGQMEGAAGSSYIDIPVQLTATPKGGAPEKLAGKVTLRRVNDVPGSTAEQREWHIHSIELNPAPQT